jgi:hypothetical protein
LSHKQAKRERRLYPQPNKNEQRHMQRAAFVQAVKEDRERREALLAARAAADTTRPRVSRPPSALAIAAGLAVLAGVRGSR